MALGGFRQAARRGLPDYAYPSPLQELSSRSAFMADEEDVVESRPFMSAPPGMVFVSAAAQQEAHGAAGRRSEVEELRAQVAGLQAKLARPRGEAAPAAAGARSQSTSSSAASSSREEGVAPGLAGGVRSPRYVNVAGLPDISYPSVFDMGLPDIRYPSIFDTKNTFIELASSEPGSSPASRKSPNSCPPCLKEPPGLEDQIYASPPASQLVAATPFASEAPWQLQVGGGGPASPQRLVLSLASTVSAPRPGRLRLGGTELPSAGSALHATGQCKPCAHFHNAKAPCKNGAQCEFCHICGRGELKRRQREVRNQKELEERIEGSSGSTLKEELIIKKNTSRPRARPRAGVV